MVEAFDVKKEWLRCQERLKNEKFRRTQMATYRVKAMLLDIFETGKTDKNEAWAMAKDFYKVVESYEDECV